MLECQAQAFKYWTPYPGQLRLHAYSHLASGAGGLLYWNWHSIHSGYETYWKGILSHDMGTNPAYEEVCQAGAGVEEDRGSTVQYEEGQQDSPCGGQSFPERL